MTICERSIRGAAFVAPLLFASVAVAQTTITHALNAGVVLPENRNFFDKPINASACTDPEEVQVSFNVGSAVQIGTLSIFIRTTSDCTTLPTNQADVINGAPQVNTLGRPDNWPKPADKNVLSTKTFLDAGKLCEANAAPHDLVEYRLCVVYKDTNNANETNNKIVDFVQVRVDTKAPNAISDLAAGSGDGTLSLTWTAPETDSLASYHIIATGADGDIKDFTVTAPATSARVDEITNGIDYSIVVYATDIAGNESAASNEVVAQGVPTGDFWNTYNGREKGGFCFVSTAAYGSYDAPFVQVFRDFRDAVLAKTSIGRTLILWYYRHGLPMAAWLVKHEWARRSAAVLLVVPYLAVWPLVRLPPVVLAAAVGMLLALVAAFVLRRRRALLACLALVTLASVARPAFAIDSVNELIERDDDTGRTMVVPPPRFEFALKLGPYYPSIDKDADAEGRYALFFGDTAKGLISKGSKIRLEATADVYVLQKWGLLGFTGTAGFWQAQGHSRICAPDGTGTTCDTVQGLATSEESSDKVLLTIIPLSLGIVYKLDIFWRRWGVPLVPFIRAGIDAYFWRVDSGNRQARKPGSTYNALRGTGFGQGVTFGWHVNPGLAFALDIIEPNAARRAYSFMGLKGSYLTFEWMFSGIDDFGSATSWDLSQSTFLGGLAIEF